MSEHLVADASERGNPDRMLEEVIADYIHACDTGNAPDRRRILEQNPVIAEDLKGFFAQRDRMHRMSQPIRGFAEEQLRQIGPGQHIGYVGDYELLEELARGGMGVVFKARQKALGRLVAVKMIAAGRLASDDDVQRFLLEAKAAASLQHPHIVSIHEVGQHEGWHYFSMEFVEGRDLSAILRENLLSAKQAATYVRQMAQAIHYAHQHGTLHRDLKPSNVLIDQHDQVRITDFGLATRVEQDSDLTRPGQIIGTPSYMPPEQAQGQRSSIGVGSDVYSLGAVLYECLTGRPPFRADSVMKTIEQVIHIEAPSPRVLNPGIPRDLETICLKCLEKEPRKRYATAAELADDLDRYLAGQPILARPIGRRERAQRRCRKNPVVSSLSFATLVLLAFVATGYYREHGLRYEVQQSLSDLQTEQRHSSLLQTNVMELEQAVDDLEQRRAGLNESLAQGSQKLLRGEEQLHQTYLKLARHAWQNDEVELADFYLDQCPLAQRKSEWQELKRQCHPPMQSLDGSHCVAITADGRLLAAGGGDQRVKVWEVASGTLLFSLEGHASEVTAVDFNADGSLLASGGGTEVIVWDVGSGTRKHLLEGHTQPVTDVEFGPQGHLASASYQARWNQGEVKIWDVKRFQSVATLPGCKYVVFNHTGQSLATAVSVGSQSWDLKLVVWDIARIGESEPSLAVTVGGADSACRPAFHPAKNELAVSKGSDSVEFWDIDSKRVVKRFSGEVRVGGLAYSSDGLRLAYTGITNGSFNFHS